MEEQTIYKIETTDKNEAMLMLNATRMAQVLYDLLAWQRAIYNGKDYNNVFLVNGKIMQQKDYLTYETQNNDDVKMIYLYETIERTLEEILSDVKDFIYNYYE